MRVVTLGGSGAGGNTGRGCSGYLVMAEQTRIVLDLGPGTLPELRRHTDFRTLDAIVISHVHLDHVLDLLALRFALAYNPVPPPRQIPLWMPPGSQTFLQAAAAAFAPPGDDADFFSSVFELGTYDPEGPLTIGSVRLRFSPTNHFIPCWATRVTAGEPSRDVVYTADTGPVAHLAAFAADAYLLIAESNSVEPSDQPREERGHLTAREAGALARDANVERLVLTHLWEELGYANYHSEASNVFAGRTDLAAPGLVIEW